jgi:NitT/TauT family transport system ATP-binding protein
VSGPAQIVIDQVSHYYRPPVGREVLALEDISLEVREREFLALLGPSGCGKSTLLYLIGGFLPIETGTILVDGAPVRGPGPDRGIVFQHFALFPWNAKACRAPSARPARSPSSISSASPASRTAIPPSFPAA